ncbi:MAG: hypothetical protein SFY92_09190 [Verrucomicrobiae bacterium]|nr:hypothetical protein [Verrucomicrobiae bacterium]
MKNILYLIIVLSSFQSAFASNSEKEKLKELMDRNTSQAEKYLDERLKSEEKSNKITLIVFDSDLQVLREFNLSPVNVGEYNFIFKENGKNVKYKIKILEINKNFVKLTFTQEDTLFGKNIHYNGEGLYSKIIIKKNSKVLSGGGGDHNGYYTVGIYYK